MFEWADGVAIETHALAPVPSSHDAMNVKSLNEAVAAAPQLRFEFFIAWEGLLGGALWALSNALVIPTVKLLGLGVGFTLYHSVNLVFGYLIGVPDYLSH